MPLVFLEIVRRFATICIYFFAVPLAIFLIAKRPLDAALALFAFAATLLFFSRCLFLSNFLNCFFDYLLFLCNHRRYILENKKTLINVYTLIIKLQVETCFWKMYTKVHKHNYRVDTTFISINYYVYAQKKI